MKNSYTLFILALLTACSAPSTQSDTSEQSAPDVYQNVIPELKACLEAHGGLDTWLKFKSLEYDRLSSSGSGEHGLVDLVNRKDLLVNDTAYTIGFDGNRVWITPDMETMKNPRFFHNLYFYFFAFPFVVADPGTNQEYLGEQEFNGVNYKKIKITYGDGVGDSPEDQYILWINAQSNMLSFINYSVTYFDRSRAEKYNALFYTSWQEIQGLMVPNLLSSFRWENDSLGEARGTNTFSGIKFSETQPDQRLFEMPEGAMVDEMEVSQ